MYGWRVVAAALTYSEEVKFKDDKVQAHGQDHGTQQPQVLERRHHHKRLVLRDTTMYTMTK